MADKRFEKSRTNILPLLKLHVPSNILRKVTEVKSQSRSFFSAENREISKDPWTETCHNNTRSRAALLLRAAKATWRANLYQLIPFPHYPIIQFRGRTVAVAVAVAARAPLPPPSINRNEHSCRFFTQRIVVTSWNDHRGTMRGKRRRKEEKKLPRFSILDSIRDATRFPRFSRLTTINGDWPRVT